MGPRTGTALTLPLILIVLGFVLIFLAGTARQDIYFQAGLGMLLLGLILQLFAIPRRR